MNIPQLQLDVVPLPITQVQLVQKQLGGAASTPVHHKGEQACIQLRVREGVVSKAQDSSHHSLSYPSHVSQEPSSKDYPQPGWGHPSSPPGQHPLYPIEHSPRLESKSRGLHLTSPSCSSCPRGCALGYQRAGSLPPALCPSKLGTWQRRVVYWPACACSSTPSSWRVRNASPTYHGTEIFTSLLNSQDRRPLPWK